MAFVDEIRIHAESGKGGDGVIRWARTKETARGGPSGGDGGKGGDVILLGVRDIAALSQYRFQKKFRAEAGEAGKNELKQGKAGEDLVLQIPVGTIAQIKGDTKEYEITKEGEQITLFRGGKAGLGNARFRSSTNQNPFERTEGKKGKGGDIQLTLKLIADAGLIGLPNAGKSSLLNALTRAKAKVGNYPFTTLGPNLADFYGNILADIPGLIEGASGGRGLGIKFLKHVERTGILLHLVSAEQDEPLAAYREVRKEIESFERGLSDKTEVVVLSKSDLLSPEDLAKKMQELQRGSKREVLSVSVQDPVSLKSFADKLTSILPKAL